MSLFSPLLNREIETKFGKHCPIKGLGSKSRVICEDCRRPQPVLAQGGVGPAAP
jgi:hypothetical protein